MKRLIYTSTSQQNSRLMKLDIEVSYDSEYVRTGSILNIHDNEFFDFESAILSDFELRDFVLEDSYESNRADSISQYYIYSKTNEEGTKLKVIIELRISDHNAPDRVRHGKLIKQEDLERQHLNKLAKKIAEERYNQKKGYVPRFMNIVINDENYKTYEEALRDIEKRLDLFDR